MGTGSGSTLGTHTAQLDKVVTNCWKPGSKTDPSLAASSSSPGQTRPLLLAAAHIVLFYLEILGGGMSR